MGSLTKWIKTIMGGILFYGLYGCALQSKKEIIHPPQEPLVSFQSDKPINKPKVHISKPQVAKKIPFDSTLKKAKNTHIKNKQELQEEKKVKPKENPNKKEKVEEKEVLQIQPDEIVSESISHMQDILEGLSGEQSSEEVQEDGQTYNAFVTYKLGTKIKHGKEILYYLDGTIAQIGFYLDGKREGLYKIFSQKGTLIYEAYYRAGYLHGICRLFDISNGALRSEMHFENGMQDGEMKIYDTSGLLWYSFSYKNGKKDGPVREFNEKGEIQREVFYSDDKEGLR